MARKIKTEWKPIKNTKGIFEVSNTGLVRRVDGQSTKQIARTLNKQRGYLYASIQAKRSGVKRKNWSVHRLVAEHFIDNPKGLPQVNHIDGNKLNNRIDNLEWCTAAHNNSHARVNGLNTLDEKWKAACGTVLQPNDVREIRNLKGEKSYKKIAEQFGTSYSNVAHIMRGSRWGWVDAEN